MFVQRYDGNGNSLQGDEWYAGAGATGIAVDKQGSYAIASVEPDGSGVGLFVTVYWRSGAIKVPRFKANAFAESSIGAVAIASNASGQLALAWTGSYNGFGWTSYARTFSAVGAATSSQVALAAASPVMMAQGIALDSAGNFGVVWTAGSSYSDVDAYFRRFSNAGFAQISPVVASTYTAGNQANASVAMTPEGIAVVTWESAGQDGSSWGVYGQRFDAYGFKAGGEFRINDSTAGEQTGSRVAVTNEGNFFVSWHSDNRANVPTSVPSIYMRQYWANGMPVGGEQALYAPPSPQVPLFPFVGVDPAGGATIGWRTSFGSGDTDIYALRYWLDTQPPVTELQSGVGLGSQSGAAGSWTYFKITVPSGRPTLSINLTSPGVGNANLYGSLGSLPTLAAAEVSSTQSGNSEGIFISNVPAGTWYFGLYGVTAYSGVMLTATY